MNEKPVNRETFKLWKHQENAVNMVEKYIAAFNETEPRAALVQMPTGTGKTGVAAVLSMCFPQLPVVLILTPRVELRNQMIDDVREKFWNHIDGNPQAFTKKVMELLPSNADNCLDSIGNHGAVLVGTPHTLLDIRKHYPECFEQIKKTISLIIFDEGHYEPAESWAEAARALAKPTVLLSATPYRNDFRIFRVDPFYSFSYSYREAVADRFLRAAAFETTRGKPDIKTFASKLETFFQGKFQGLKPDAIKEPRVIVRCGTRDEVEHMTAELRRLGQAAVGIHDRFTRKDNKFHCYNHYNDVPPGSKTTFWVHQFKLMEGLDNQDFCLLAMYTPFADDRATVQQIGRIIRNRSREAWQTAYVFAARKSGIEEAWNRFLRNDAAIYDAVKKADQDHAGAMINIDPDFPRRLMEEQPLTEYIDGRFSEKFDIHAPKAYECLNLPRSTRIFKMTKGLPRSLDDIQEEILAQWRSLKRDPTAPQNQPDADTRVILYYSYRNSPLLLPEWYFMECTLGVTILHWSPPFLFYYDRFGSVPDSISEARQELTTDELKKLLEADKERRLFLAGLANTNLGQQSLRSSLQRAFSLGATIHGVADHGFICRKAYSFIEIDKANDLWLRRDVGFRRKQVSETTEERLTIDDYIPWLEGLANLLKSPKTPRLKVLNRFAQSCPPPPDPRAMHILLDLFGVENRFKNTDNPGQSLKVNDCGAEVSYKTHSTNGTGSFKYKINGVYYTFDIRYDDIKKRYHLEEKHKALNREFRHEYKKMGVVTYLNREQAFRAVPASPGVIYAYNEFFRPILCTASMDPANQGENQVDMCSIIHGESKLMGASSEKGKECKPGGIGWQDGCVFDIIDSAHGKNRKQIFDGLLQGIDTLVCDDMGTEAADFIAADSKGDGRVFFIHAKAFKRPLNYAAAKLADVCSQVVKNLQFIDRFSNVPPPGVKKWGKEWRANGVSGCVEKRIRVFNNGSPTTPANVWEHIKKILQNPLSRIEVWMVLGNGYSKNELKRLMQSSTPPPPVLIQNIYQLESAWSIVSTMGATLRVFGRP